MQEKGCLYGGILGVIWYTCLLLLTLGPLLLLPKDLIYGPGFSEEVARKITEQKISSLISEVPLGFLKTIGLAAIGGWLGEYYSRRKLRRRVLNKQ